MIGKSRSNTAGINAVNRMLKRIGYPIPTEIVRIAYLDNMIGQDHRTIKKIMRKGQLTPCLCPFVQFAALAE